MGLGLRDAKSTFLWLQFKDPCGLRLDGCYVLRRRVMLCGVQRELEFDGIVSQARLSFTDWTESGWGFFGRVSINWNQEDEEVRAWNFAVRNRFVGMAGICKSSSFRSKSEEKCSRRVENWEGNEITRFFTEKLFIFHIVLIWYIRVVLNIVFLHEVHSIRSQEMSVLNNLSSTGWKLRLRKPIKVCMGKPRNSYNR